MHRRTRETRRVGGDQGAVTAEAALVIPSLLIVLMLCLSLVVTVHAQLRCVDAAREGARLAARGEERADVVATAQRLGPDGAAVSVARKGEWVVVSVRATVRPLGRGLRLPGFPVSAKATVEPEGR